MPRGDARFICLGLLLMFLLRGFIAGALAQQPTLVIQGGTLIDGTGKAPVPDAVIVIEKNKIVAVGKRGSVPSPRGARVIEAAGKFILPGLINMHVHWRDWMPELFLAHGVTTAVDLSSTEWTLAQKQLLADGRIMGPRLFTTTGAIGGRLLWDSPPYGPVESVAVARRLTQE